MVRYTDEILGKLVKAIDNLGIRDNTIIFWTTDNGTSGNITGRLKGKSVRGGKTYLTENGVNQPFIVNWPGRVPAGVETDALVDFSDLLPTFADLGNASLPKDFHFDGKSFKDVILGYKTKSDRDWILTMGSLAARLDYKRATNLHKFRDRALRDRKYKVFVDTLGQISHVYNLTIDAEEKENLINSNSKEIKTVLNKFKTIISNFPREDAQPNYTKLSHSIYDINPEALNEKAEKWRKRSNHAPLVEY